MPRLHAQRARRTRILVWTRRRSMPRVSRNVNRFWFGGDGAAAQAARDALIRDDARAHARARGARRIRCVGRRARKRRLALIILFDQVPRNAYRGTAAAFAFDREALALSVEGLQLAADAALDPVERLFFYLPLEHAESMEAQDACDGGVRPDGGRGAAGPAGLRRVAARLCAQAPRRHREVRALPDRNAVLGRESTPEEQSGWLRSGRDGSRGAESAPRRSAYGLSALAESERSFEPISLEAPSRERSSTRHHPLSRRRRARRSTTRLRETSP